MSSSKMQVEIARLPESPNIGDLRGRAQCCNSLHGLAPWALSSFTRSDTPRRCAIDKGEPDLVGFGLALAP